MDGLVNVTRLGIDPLLGGPLLWAAAGLVGLGWLLYLVLRGKAWLSRAAGLLVLGAAIANPTLVEEDREPLTPVAALILDRSDSMDFGARAEAADRVFQTLRSRMESLDSLEVRIAEPARTQDGTRLFTALDDLMADVPRDRVAGAILVTDGQVHDVPDPADQASDLGPIHSVIVGDPDQGDRRIEIVDGPSFGIVGELAQVVLRVESPEGGTVPVTVSLNGGPAQEVSVTAGRDTPIPVEIARRGANYLVVETPAGPEELTLANNRAATSISGVRDRLRVLLITGKPNAAGRTWRDLLKSDPQVDLVHFTILRPPHKLDVTPIDELALIQFPTRELFEDKLTEFDLVIFDQYERRGVVTQSYLANMARYVDQGGALVIVAGEAFAGPGSLARTPLASVLPAAPTGEVDIRPFRPALSDAGERHTVTAPLSGRSWGGWLRHVGAEASAGDVLMETPEGAPLLVLDRVGEGRVGLMLSDQIWLWARGYEGGGPFSELIRRMVHWMMKEPELEERQLSMTAADGTARITLRTLADEAPPLTLETPEGRRASPDWSADGPGRFTATAPLEALGLYRAEAGGLSAIALNGPANPLEFQELEASPDRLTPVAESTGGGVLSRPDGSAPELRQVGPRGEAAGRDWLGLRQRDAYAVRASTSRPLAPSWLYALAVALILLFAWRREGR